MLSWHYMFPLQCTGIYLLSLKHNAYATIRPKPEQMDRDMSCSTNFPGGPVRWRSKAQTPPLQLQCYEPTSRTAVPPGLQGHTVLRSTSASAFSSQANRASRELSVTVIHQSLDILHSFTVIFPKPWVITYIKWNWNLIWKWNWQNLAVYRTICNY